MGRAFRLADFALAVQTHFAQCASRGTPASDVSILRHTVDMRATTTARYRLASVLRLAIRYALPFAHATTTTQSRTRPLAVSSMLAALPVVRADVPPKRLSLLASMLLDHPSADPSVTRVPLGEAFEGPLCFADTSFPARRVLRPLLAGVISCSRGPQAQAPFHRSANHLLSCWSSTGDAPETPASFMSIYNSRSVQSECSLSRRCLPIQ
uniref:Uncharacterized protein n=1 Tax=Mycena chlorophos TaxID=658473 RepID=A0ABQ0LX02_MYCCL|nr:predicted protein [Mycena chlorophos]